MLQRSIIHTAIFAVGVIWIASASHALAQSPSPSPFQKQAEELRHVALSNFQLIQSGSNPATSSGPFSNSRWKKNIVTQLFWIGEPGSGKATAWDPHALADYGGPDNPRPSARHSFIPLSFTPGLNPFYCELPYNDVGAHETKPEAPMIVPWFRTASAKAGHSVCKDRWVQIQNVKGQSCYAQWTDAGPARTDDWQYVFGNQNPEWNQYQGAGLGVSPAVREYLGLTKTDVTEWRFVDLSAVPTGPWCLYGSNNSALHATSSAKSGQ